MLPLGGQQKQQFSWPPLKYRPNVGVNVARIFAFKGPASSIIWAMVSLTPRRVVSVQPCMVANVSRIDEHVIVKYP
jgi:hypothetical protein